MAGGRLAVAALRPTVLSVRPQVLSLWPGTVGVAQALVLWPAVLVRTWR
jgi:hypothetical protein